MAVNAVKSEKAIICEEGLITEAALRLRKGVDD
jgi:hypothetical protein